MLLGAQFEVSLPTHGFASHGYVLGARQTKAQGLVMLRDIMSPLVIFGGNASPSFLMYKSKPFINLNDIKGCVLVEYDVTLPPMSWSMCTTHQRCTIKHGRKIDFGNT